MCSGCFNLFTLFDITQWGQQGSGQSPTLTSSMSSSSKVAGNTAEGGGSFGAGEEDSLHGRCKKEKGDGEESKALDKGDQDADKGKKE